LCWRNKSSQQSQRKSPSLHFSHQQNENHQKRKSEKTAHGSKVNLNPLLEGRGKLRKSDGDATIERKSIGKTKTPGY
jgi:hypothetical protein